MGLALGPVILTVVNVGAIIHLLIPAPPLAVAFALATMVSPTDPTAASNREPLPKRVMHVLEGEAPERRIRTRRPTFRGGGLVIHRLRPGT